MNSNEIAIAIAIVIILSVLGAILAAKVKVWKVPVPRRDDYERDRC
jgi:hypothetical protein